MSKKNNQNQPYLVSHVNHIVSNRLTDHMYIELTSLNLLDGMLRFRDETEAEYLIQAYSQVLNYQREMFSTPLSSDAINLVRYLVSPDRASSLSFSNTPSIRKVEKEVRNAKKKPSLKSRIVNTDEVRFVSKLS